MDYILATEANLDEIFNLVQDTIKTVYPKYYPTEVVDFFCEHHNRENILKDIKSGTVGVLIVDNSVVGTGSYSDNHITRVYVEPTQRRKGYGTYIMKRLEEIIIKNGYNKAILDASLPAAYLYETLGYKSLSHEKYIVENDVVLVYEIMEKYL